MAPVSGAPLLAMRGVEKRFGAVRALDGVDFTLEAGEVHALLGENGAGKSTLMNVLLGAIEKDAGELELYGKPYAPRGPLDARRAGIAMIHQELSLCEHLDVLENAMLGAELHRGGVLARDAMLARVRDALLLLHHPEITPERKLSALGPGARQLVEVARALVRDARIVVMDEPTSSLAQRDIEHLFEVIARLAQRGVGVIYISHFLDEVERVADRYTVLRDGRTVKSGARGELARTQLIEAMIGRTLAEAFPRIEHEPREPLLELDRLAGRKLPKHASLCLHRGEIFGIAGLLGAGRSELLRALFGLEPITSGRVTVAGVSDRGLPPWARLRQRVGLLSERRKEEGLALSMSVADNLTLSALSACSRFGVVDRRAQRAVAERFAARLAIRCPDAGTAVKQLSGGNQQKVALARLLHADADVLLLDEPTRGVDVGSKAEIYRLIGELARTGKAVIFVSSYLPELLGVCDRLAVMHRGRLGPARSVAAWSEAAVMEAATGGQSDEP